MTIASLKKCVKILKTTTPYYLIFTIPIFVCMHCTDALSLDDMSERSTIMQRVSESGKALADLDEKFRDDQKIVLKALENDGLALEFASERLKADPEIVSTAVKKNGLALQFANESMRCNGDMVERAIRQNPESISFVNEFVVGFLLSKGGSNLFKHASESVKNNVLLVKMVLTEDGALLQYANMGLRGNEDVVLTAVANTFIAFQYASDSIKRDQNMIVKAATINLQILKYVDRSVINDSLLLCYLNNKRLNLHTSKEDEVGHLLDFLPQDGLVLQYASAELRGNEAIVSAAVNQNGLSLQYASAELRGNEAIVNSAINQNGLSLQYASDELRGNEAIVSSAVKQNGLSLQYASAELRGNEAIISSAVKQNGLSLQYAIPALRAKKDTILEAVKQNGLSLQYIIDDGNYTESDKEEVILAAVGQNGLALKFLVVSDEEGRYDRINEQINEKIIQQAIERLPYPINFTEYYHSIDYHCFLRPLADSAVTGGKEFVLAVLQYSDRLVIDSFKYNLKHDSDVSSNIRQIANLLGSSMAVQGGTYKVFNIDASEKAGEDLLEILIHEMSGEATKITMSNNATAGDLARAISQVKQAAYIYLVNQHKYAANPFDDEFKPLEAFLSSK